MLTLTFHLLILLKSIVNEKSLDTSSDIYGVRYKPIFNIYVEVYIMERRTREKYSPIIVNILRIIRFVGFGTR